MIFFVAMACGTLAFADEDVTATYIQNPSFETPDVIGGTLSADNTGDRAGTGAYVVTANDLTGWTLVAPTNTETTRAVCDIMTADAVATDDNYGAPGAPSAGSQMLYLRNSWATNTASVKQTLSSLPAGYYRLTVDSKCVSTINSHYTQLVAGTKSSALTVHSAMP